MKILLAINHSKSEIHRVPMQLDKIRGTLPPIGILSLAAYLEKFGYDVKVYDSRTSNESLQKVLLNYKPDVVGATFVLQTYHQACYALEIAKKYNCITVIGGHGLEIFPKAMIDKPYIDYGIVGEGEETLLQLIKALEKKDFNGLKDIKGLSYKKNGEIIAGKPQIIKNLDELPRPAYHLIEFKKYWSIFNDYPMTTYLVGRGCPFRCAFCIKNESDKFVRFRSANLVVDDIQYLISKYKIKELVFYDDTFTLSKDYVRSLCNEILRRKIKIRFEAITRVDSLSKDDGIEFLKLLKKAGCYRLRLGVESGDEEILKAMNKKITLDQVELAFKCCEKVGIQTSAFFLIGYLNESRESFEKTLNFAIKLNPHYVAFSVAMPYPNTKLYEESYSKGLIPENYWLYNITGKTKERIPYLVANAEARAKEAYKKFYLRPRFWIKSLHHFKRLQYIKNGFRAMLSLLSYEKLH